MACYYKVRCAHVELKRCNAEITRLRTFIRHDAILHQRVINSLCITDHGLSVVLSHRWELRSAVNHIHLARLNNIANLPGYTGSRACGTRVGSLAVAREDGDQTVVVGSEDEDEDDMESDLFQDTLNTLTDYVAAIDLVA